MHESTQKCQIGFSQCLEFQIQAYTFSAMHSSKVSPGHFTKSLMVDWTKDTYQPQINIIMFLSCEMDDLNPEQHVSSECVWTILQCASFQWEPGLPRHSLTQGVVDRGTFVSKKNGFCVLVGEISNANEFWVKCDHSRSYDVLLEPDGNFVAGHKSRCSRPFQWAEVD